MDDWQALLSLSGLIGGDLELVQDSRVFRGPITQVVFAGKKIYVEVSWVAQTHLAADYLHSGEWRFHSGMKSYDFEERRSFQVDKVNGRASFRINGLLVCFVSMSAGEKLNPRKVIGLKP